MTSFYDSGDFAGWGRRGFALGAAAFCFASMRAIKAFSQQSVATFTLDTKLVNIYATVRDKRGALVQTLRKEDFQIAENGKPQTIRFFSHENDLPLTLGLLVDTSPSEARMIDQEREASRNFFRTVLDPKKDKAFVIHFDTDVELLEDLTSSLEKLDEALDKLDAVNEPKLHRSHDPGSRDDEQGPDNSSNPQNRRPPHGGGDGGTTHLYDAVYLASTQVLKSQKGRKALIVIGDGDDMGSSVSAKRAIQTAQQADAMIYCIRIVDKDFGNDHRNHRFTLPVSIPGVPGLGGPGGGGPPGGPGGGGSGGGGGGQGPDRKEGKKNLEALSSQTGGALFEVSKNVVLGDIYAQIGNELRSQYSLAYTPDANAEPGYRYIQVRVKPKGLNVQAREGYYSSQKS